MKVTENVIWICSTIVLTLVLLGIVCGIRHTIRTDAEALDKYESQVFQFGMKSRLAGVSSEANPYVNTYSREKWLEGWIAAGE
jgi:ribosome modulation factor